MSEPLKKQLEKIWNDGKVRSPNGTTEWRRYSKRTKLKEQAGLAVFEGRTKFDGDAIQHSFYSIRHGDAN